MEVKANVEKISKLGGIANSHHLCVVEGILDTRTELYLMLCLLEI